MQFQFTPLREGRPAFCWMQVWSHRFQFTPLREGRLHIIEHPALIPNFNSRPCVRGDQRSKFFRPSQHKFQFTPLREGRLSRLVYLVLLDLFQFTPLREGRQQGQRIPVHQVDFNSRPCVRGDGLSAGCRCGPTDFNSRPCVRGDVPSPPMMVVAGIFQFTPLREGRPLRPPSTASSAFLFQFTPLREGRPLFRDGFLIRCPHFNSRPCVRGDAAQSFNSA